MFYRKQSPAFTRLSPIRSENNNQGKGNRDSRWQSKNCKNWGTGQQNFKDLRRFSFYPNQNHTFSAAKLPTVTEATHRAQELFYAVFLNTSNSQKYHRLNWLFYKAASTTFIPKHASNTTRWQTDRHLLSHSRYTQNDRVRVKAHKHWSTKKHSLWSEGQSPAGSQKILSEGLMCFFKKWHTCPWCYILILYKTRLPNNFICSWFILQNTSMCFVKHITFLRKSMGFFSLKYVHYLQIYKNRLKHVSLLDWSPVFFWNRSETSCIWLTTSTVHVICILVFIHSLKLLTDQNVSSIRITRSEDRFNLIA